MRTYDKLRGETAPLTRSQLLALVCSGGRWDGWWGGARCGGQPFSQHPDSHPVLILGTCSGWLPLFPQWCRNGLGGSGQCLWGLLTSPRSTQDPLSHLCPGVTVSGTLPAVSRHWRDQAKSLSFRSHESGGREITMAPISPPAQGSHTCPRGQKGPVAKPGKHRASPDAYK